MSNQHCTFFIKRIKSSAAMIFCINGEHHSISVLFLFLMYMFREHVIVSSLTAELEHKRK